MPQKLLQHRPLGEGRPTGQHVVERATERVKIAPDIGAARVACLLRRNVIERSQRDATGRQVVVRVLDVMQPREAHVDQFRPSLGRNQNVRWFDVAMHDVALAGVNQGLGDLQHMVNRVSQGQRPVLLN